MVEQRHPALKPHRHGRPIHFRQNVLGQVADHVEVLHARDEVREILRHRGVPQRAVRLTTRRGDLLRLLPLAHQPAIDGIGLELVENGGDFVQLVAGQRRPPRGGNEGKQAVPRLRRERTQSGGGSAAQRARHERRGMREPFRPEIAIIAGEQFVAAVAR